MCVWVGVGVWVWILLIFLSSVQSGGHVYYLGMGTPGVMAIVDASECPPTFGVDYGMVRAFITGGYTTLGNRHGSLASVSV